MPTVGLSILRMTVRRPAQAQSGGTCAGSPVWNVRRLDDRKSCRELRQIGYLTDGSERKRESSDELLDVVVSEEQ
jgi:hypothetical protein